MKIVSITDVRQDATKLIKHAQTVGEPVLVLRRSQPVAYLVDARQYEAMQEDLKRLRHAAFWEDVTAASDEYRTGDARVYDDAQALITELGLLADDSQPR